MSAIIRPWELKVPPQANKVPAAYEEISEGKWPVWLRLVTIIGLSAALWAAIIWACVSLFSVQLS